MDDQTAKYKFYPTNMVINEQIIIDRRHIVYVEIEDADPFYDGYLVCIRVVSGEKFGVRFYDILKRKEFFSSVLDWMKEP